MIFANFHNDRLDKKFQSPPMLLHSRVLIAHLQILQYKDVMENNLQKYI